MPKEESTKKALREAYTAATQRLRDGHREQFNTLYREEAEKKGVEWKPRLSESEKAESQIRELLAKHPDLVHKVAVELTQPAGPAVPDTA